MLEKEKKILQNEYERSLEIVQKSDFHRLFVNEKIIHSHQVLDAANYLLKKENTFKPTKNNSCCWYCCHNILCFLQAKELVI